MEETGNGNSEEKHLYSKHSEFPEVPSLHGDHADGTGGRSALRKPLASALTLTETSLIPREAPRLPRGRAQSRAQLRVSPLKGVPHRPTVERIP